MRGALFVGNGRVEQVDLPVPRPEPGEVLLKVAYNGVCGSERGVFLRGMPRVVGHEVAGTVADANGTDIPVGTRCAVYIPLHCGECKFCRKGSANCCLNLKGMVGWNEPWNGGYGEYMRVPARCILPLHDSIGLDVAVLLLDTFGTAWHAVRLGRPVGASRALVIGCGPLGLGVVAGLRAFGVPEVFASDIAPGRLEAAEELGARPVAPAEVAGLKELQIAIDVTGSTETPMQAIRAIEPEGRMVLLGEPGPWQYDPRGISLRDFSLIRSWYFTIPEFAENQQMLLDGKVDSKVLISHVFPLEKLEEAYTLFAAGRTRKVLTQVVEPE